MKKSKSPAIRIRRAVKLNQTIAEVLTTIEQLKKEKEIRINNRKQTYDELVQNLQKIYRDRQNKILNGILTPTQGKEYTEQKKSLIYEYNDYVKQHVKKLKEIEEKISRKQK